MNVVPPKEVFEVAPQDKLERLSVGGYDIPGAKNAARSKDGEMLTVFEGFPLPRKGVIYAEAVLANNQVKRLTLALISPFAGKELLLVGLGFLLTPYKWKISFLERFLDNYVRLANAIYLGCERVPYLKKEYYNNCSKALWDLSATFLIRLGILEPTAQAVGKIFATLFEYDDLYRITFEDPMSEFSKEEVLNDPALFMERFLKILSQRSPNEFLIGKFASFLKLLKFAFYLPKIKNAFRESVKQINFEWLKLDEYDIYWNLNRSDYDLQGRNLEDRFSEFLNRMIEHIKKINNCEEVSVSQNPDGSFQVQPIL